MMKKFGVALLSLMLLCCFVPMLAACGETQQIYRVKIVEFTEEKVAMYVDSQPYQLNWEIEDSVALNQKVTFSSTRPEIATVDENGLVTPVSVGTTVIEIASDDNPKAKTNSCTVYVLAQKQTLAQPQNLRYIADTHELTWDKVVEDTVGMVISDTSTFVPKYELSLTTTTGTDTIVVSTNVYDKLEPGVEYSAISVKALGNEYLYNDSQPTPSIKVHVLSSVSNLHVTTDKKYANLNTSDVISDDDLTIASRNFNLEFTAPADGSSDISNYNIMLLNGNLEEVTGEKREAFNNLVANAKYADNVFSINLNTLPSGEYFIRVQLIGEADQDTYDSAYVTSKRIKVLTSPTNMMLSGDNKQTLSWDRVTWASGYQLLIEYSLSSLDTTTHYANIYLKSTQTTTFDLSDLVDLNGNKFVETSYTKFNIYMFALGTDDDTSGMVIDSARSADTARAQLGQVTGIKLATARASNEAMTLTWNSVTNVGTYLIKIFDKDDGKQVAQYELADNSLTIEKDVDFLVGKSGKFEITVTAMPSATQNYTKSIVSEAFEIEKLKSPTVTSTKGVISWDRIEGVASQPSYTITYNQGTEKKTVNIMNLATVYDFSYKNYTSGSYTDFCVTARGSSDTDKSLNNILFDSDSSNTYTVVKASAPEQFVARQGELTLDTGSFDSFTLNVKNTQTKGDLANVSVLASTINKSIASIVAKMTPGVEYAFTLVGLGQNSQEDNVLYVKTNPSTTYVYISEPVENMSAKNGVLTWDMPETLYNYITTYNQDNQKVLNEALVSGVNYCLSITNSTASKNITFNLEKTQSFDFGSSINSGTTVNLGVQISFVNAVNPDVCILNSATTYNNYNKLSTIDSSTVTVTEDQDTGAWVVKWPVNTIKNLSYLFVVKHGEDTYTMTAKDTDDTITSDSYFYYYTLDIDNKTSGTYNLTIQVLGADTSYLNSDISNIVEFTKLEKPTVEIEDGKVVWKAVSTSNAVSYDLQITKSENDVTSQYVISNILSTSYDLSTYTELNPGVVTLSVRAISTRDMLLSSEFSDEIKAIKLDSTKTTVSAVTSDTISWTFGDTVTMDSEAQNVTVGKFDYKVYRANNTSNSTTPLQSGTLVLDESTSDFSYTMPHNNTFSSGDYVLKLTPKGASAISNLMVGFIDGQEISLYIRKLAQVSDLNLNNKTVSWTKLSEDDLSIRYNINISSLSDYTYVVNDGDALTVNDETKADEGWYVYDVPTSDNKYSIPLLKNVFTSTNDDCGIVQNVLQSKTNNYIAEGNTFNLLMTTTITPNTDEGTSSLDIRSKQLDGTTYYVFDSNSSSIPNITLLDAPLIQYKNGTITWTTNKTNFEKLEFTYTPYYDSGSTSNGKLVLAQDTNAETQVLDYTTYNTRSYDLSKLFDVDSSAEYYVLTAQSIGNNAKNVSSRASTYGYVIANIQPITVNTNETSPNGWYINKGEVSWNNVKGAGAYTLRFEQLGTNNIITRTQEITISSTGAETYTYLPGNELNLTQNSNFYLTLKAVGTQYRDQVIVNNQTLGCMYASSKYLEDADATSTKYGKLLMRQFTPNNTSRVYNGDLTWDAVDKANGYNLRFTSGEQDLRDVKDISDTTYVLCEDEVSWNTNTYSMSLQTIGDDKICPSNKDANGNYICYYLSSLYGNGFAFRYINAEDIKLNVSKGDFSWQVSDDASGWNAIYAVGLKLTATGEYVYLDNQTTLTNDLADYAGQSINSLVVKITGDEDSTTIQRTPMVRSSNSKIPLTNLYKLPNIANYKFSDGQTVANSQIIINEIGDIVWNCGYTEALSSIGFGTKVSVVVRNGTSNAVAYSYNTTLETASLSGSMTYSYDDTTIYGLTVYPNYEMSVCVVGTDYQDNADTITYLTSNKAIRVTKKFGRVSNFVMSDGINLTWGMDSTPIITAISNGNVSSQVEPDRIMVEYSTDNQNFTKLVFDAKLNDNFVENLTQFLGDGSYYIRLSVFSTAKDDENVRDYKYFRSSPIKCTYNGSDLLTFGGVLGGLSYVGASNVPYFNINNDTQLRNIQPTLDKNTLAISTNEEDTTTIEGTGQQYLLSTVAHGANFILTDNITLSSITALYSGEEYENIDFVDNLHSGDVLDANEEDYMVLYGVFDGNGKTISNVQTRNSGHIGLFDVINADAVIKNLTLSFASIQLDHLGCDYTEVVDEATGESEVTYIAPDSSSEHYFGLIVRTNRGTVDGCTVKAVSEDVITDEYFGKTNNIIFGMLVGLNTITEITDSDGTTSTIRGQVVNSSNGINMSKKNIADEQFIQLGGIVGVNDRADIINCVNGIDAINQGNLAGLMVGGIAYQNKNDGLIYGCINNGDLIVYAKAENQTITAGGIVAFNSSGADIIMCTNRGNVEASTVTITQTYNNAQLGGIVGRAYNDDTGTMLITNNLQTYIDSSDEKVVEGVYVIPHNSGSDTDNEEDRASYWSTVDIGYIIGSVSGRISVEDCVYRASPTITESDIAKAKHLNGFYPEQAIGNDTASDTNMDMSNVTDNDATTNDDLVSYLNEQSTSVVERVQNCPVKVRFVQTTSGFVGIVSESEYQNLVLEAQDISSATWTTQTVTTNTSTGFVVKLKNEMDFDLTTIKVAKVLYGTDETSAIATVPTAAGTYNVYVYYGLPEIVNADSSIFATSVYTYIIKDDA